MNRKAHPTDLTGLQGGLPEPVRRPSFAPAIPARPKSRSSESGTRWVPWAFRCGVWGKLTAGRHKFHDVELSGIVKHACHALAIDERRRQFRASLWGDKHKPGQTVEQVWFAGVYSDVGGSSGDPSLGSTPLSSRSSPVSLPARIWRPSTVTSTLRADGVPSAESSRGRAEITPSPLPFRRNPGLP